MNVQRRPVMQPKGARRLVINYTRSTGFPLAFASSIGQCSRQAHSPLNPKAPHVPGGHPKPQ
jgi:hypothetical protein